MQTNNKLRDALMQIYERVNSLDENCGVDPVEIRDIAKAALAEPVRNYEVGTAEEQTARYRKFCSSHKYLGSDFSHMCRGFGKGRCPFFNSRTKSQCEFAWAQMPYTSKEGGAK